jgi:peroxisomal coenzyme A diphosphatase NUDT7
VKNDEPSFSMSEIDQLLHHRTPGFLGQEQARHAAVLIPLIHTAAGIHIVLQVRAAHLQHQPGDVCLPGGRKEAADDGMQTTAQREVCEELGIEAEQVQVFAPLDKLWTPQQTIIHPFVGRIADGTVLSPDPAEVQEVFQVPLSFFLHTRPERFDIALQVDPPEDFPFHLIEGGRNYPWRGGFIPEYFYQYGDYVIWGLTARIILHFIDVLKSDLQQQDTRG